MEELIEGPAPKSEDVERGRLPVVAIVGRPNAGKSTLFNRLVPGRTAIVDKTPGVTRDRNIGIAKVRGRRFLVIDTGGFEDADGSSLAESVRAQSALAAEEADVVVVLLDGSEGLNPDDAVLLDRLRRLRKPLVFAVNKVDDPKHEGRIADFYALGIDEMLPISAAHGIGVDDLFHCVVDLLPAVEAEAEEVGADDPVRLAFIGRPNAGKSSLLNRIVGYERSIVDATPGTTRDALDTPFERDGRKYVLVDTAGIRRRSRVVELIERVSVVRALSSIERGEVAALIIDAAQGMSDQDARIANYAWERRRALLLVFNKWDLLPEGENSSKRFFADIAYRYPSLADVPMLALSALKGSGVRALFPALEQVVANHRRQIGTAELNRVLERAVEGHAPRATRGRPPRFFYATQTGSAPPVITLFCSAPDKIAPDYERYLYNHFRKAFGLHGTPLQIKIRKREH
jgi:GTP-binding protein